MEIQKILPLSLYRFHYDGDLEKILEWVIDITNKDSKEYSGVLEIPFGQNPYSVISLNVPEVMRDLPDLYEFMMDSVNEMVAYNKYQHPDIFMSQIWTNIEKTPGQQHTRHVHPNAVFSSVFNIHATEPNCVTVFHGGTPSGDEDTVMGQHCYTNKKFDAMLARMPAPDTEGPTDGVQFEVIEHMPGDFILFRSHIAHSVPPFIPQSIDDIRSTLSANFWFHQMGRSDRATILRVKPDYDYQLQKYPDRGIGWEDDKNIERERENSMEGNGTRSST